jgi:glycosyltransferase involved in cell wall biosynthesis
VGYQLQVVVVENNLTADCELLVSDLAKAHAHLENVVYQLEPKLGISFARNACAQLAIDLGADYLAFIDDDETVTPEWLVHHMAAMENLNAHLLGGPVRLADAAYTLNWLNRIMFKALKHRYQEVELKALAVSSAPHSNNPTVHTNNWICKTSVFKTHGLFFNEELRQMGGEDTEFFRDCVNKGLKTGWVANAVVWDHLPQSRLSVRYQYERSRDQSNAHLHYKLNTKTTSVPEACAAILVRLIYFPFLLVLVVAVPSKFSLKFIRNVGWIKGRVDALLGKRHAHYKMTTGT